MKYNTLSDHDNVFEIPETMTTDKPLWLGVTDIGLEADTDVSGWRQRFAYSFATGPYEADVQWQGDDVRGPAIGSVSAAEIAATLMGFASAYGEGELIDNRDDGGDLFLIYDGESVAPGETAQFLYDNAERFGLTASELEEGYIAYTDTYWNEPLGLFVKRAFPTGKEPE